MCCGKMISARMRAQEENEKNAKNSKVNKKSFFKTRGRRAK